MELKDPAAGCFVISVWLVSFTVTISFWAVATWAIWKLVTHFLG